MAGPVGVARTSTPAAVPTFGTALQQGAAQSLANLCTANFELGTLGATIAAGGSGNATPWDAVQIGSGALLTYDSTVAYGSQSAKFDKAGTSVTDYLTWQASFAPSGLVTAPHYGRMYVYMTANPAVALRVVSFFQPTTVVDCSIRISAAGKIALVDANNTQIALSATAIALNQWVRIEWRVEHHPTTGQMTVRLFNSADSLGAPTETIDSGSTMNTGIGASFVRIGDVAGVALTTPFWLDGIVAGETDTYPAPLSNIVAGAASSTAAAPGVTFNVLADVGTASSAAAAYGPQLNLTEYAGVSTSVPGVYGPQLIMTLHLGEAISSAGVFAPAPLARTFTVGAAASTAVANGVTFNIVLDAGEAISSVVTHKPQINRTSPVGAAASTAAAFGIVVGGGVTQTISAGTPSSVAAAYGANLSHPQTVTVGMPQQMWHTNPPVDGTVILGTTFPENSGPVLGRHLFITQNSSSSPFNPDGWDIQTDVIDKMNGTGTSSVTYPMDPMLHFLGIRGGDPTFPPGGLLDIANMNDPTQPGSAYVLSCLDKWIVQLRKLPRRVAARMWHEFNDRNNAYGLGTNPNNTPANFVQAWQNVVDYLTANGVRDKLSLIWCQSGHLNNPVVATSYYPGSNYVDWIGSDFYRDSPSFSPISNIGLFATTFAPYGKPMMLCELGLDNTDPNRAAAVASIDTVLASYPQIKAICYFNSSNWKIADLPAGSGVQAAFVTWANSATMNGVPTQTRTFAPIRDITIGEATQAHAAFGPSITTARVLSAGVATHANAAFGPTLTPGPVTKTAGEAVSQSISLGANVIRVAGQIDEETSSPITVLGYKSTTAAPPGSNDFPGGTSIITATAGLITSPWVLSGDGSMQLPLQSDAARPPNAALGAIAWNTPFGSLEAQTGSAWVQLGAPSDGGRLLRKALFEAAGASGRMLAANYDPELADGPVYSSPSSGATRYIAVYWPGGTMTGMAYLKTVAGSYTDANARSGTALYQSDGTTLTRRAHTTSQITESLGIRKRDWTTFDILGPPPAGIYYVAIRYVQSAETTAPIYAALLTQDASTTGGDVNHLATPNNWPLVFTQTDASQALPATVAISGLTQGAANLGWIGLY